MRQGLFLKIFTWFWLTVILSAVALEGASSLARRNATTQGARFERLLPDAARTAAVTLEDSGEGALAAYLSQLQQTQSVMAYFFDIRGDERTHRWVPPAVREQGLVALREPGLRRRGGGGEIAALHVVGGSGHNYAMVLVLPRNTVANYWNMPPYWRLAIIILISGVFCFLIARHVTAPLLRLQTAAAGIAEGHLSTRVSTDLHRRGDEIAGLALDFNRMAARIEALVHGQKQLLANVSHELRSPLSRLLVAHSLAKQDAPENLERIGIEARRLDKLIGQLLTLSRIDSTVDDGHRAAIDLTALVHEVASDADFEGRAHTRKVVVTADTDCVTDGNEEALRSALENILRNAVRYTAEGTEVEVSLRSESGRAVIRVRDHGPGVPDDMLRNIFVPFRRAESSTDGSGLGLAIAERAVVAHHGTVRASNAEGGGLIVEVCLPASLR
jgi:two-component system sensor histidine kinase CpxA